MQNPHSLLGLVLTEPWGEYPHSPSYLPGGWCDPTELVKPGKGHCDGGEGEVGRVGAVAHSGVAGRLLCQAPHLLLHLQHTI